MPKTITIYVDAYGNFKYENAVQHLTPKETVQWVSNDGDFAVNFGNWSPFTGAFEFQGMVGKPAPDPPVAVDSQALGVYTYTVAVRRQDGKVFIDGGCPEVKVP